VSGIVSMMFCGIIMSVYGSYNLTHEEKEIANQVWETFASILET